MLVGVIVVNAINIVLSLSSLALILVGFAFGLGAICLILWARRAWITTAPVVDALAATLAPFGIVVLIASAQTLPADAPAILVANAIVLFLVVFTMCLPCRVPGALGFGLAAIAMSTFADIASLMHTPFTPAGANLVAELPLLFIAVMTMHPTFARLTTPEPLADARHRMIRLGLLSGSMAITLLLVVSDERLLARHGGWVVAAPLALAGLLTFRMLRSVRILDDEAATQRARARTDELTGLRSPQGLRTFVTGDDDAPDSAPPLLAPWTMVALDLDGFRRINDAFGIDGGDDTLRAVATTLESIVPPDAGLCRLDADEFAIVLPGDDPVRARRVALLALAALREVLDAGPSLGRMSIRATAGIAVDAEGGPGVIERLTRKALTAVGHAQKDGDSQVLEFHPNMVAEASTDLALLRDLQHALKDGSGIHAVYQPIVDLLSGETVAVESLARWRRQDGAVLEPARYLALAEASGWIGPFGQRMLQLACQGLLALRQTNPSLRVHVNVSPIAAAAPSFVPATLAAIQRAGLPMDAVVLEVTEQVLLPRASTALHAFMTLAGEGVGLALDDFGSGYASVGYLSRLPLDHIKIDKSFTAELGSEGALLEDLMPFLNARGPTIIAEGVETAIQLDHLRRLNCALGQGYLLGAPSPIEALV